MGKIVLWAVPIVWLSRAAYPGDYLAPNTIDCSQFRKVGNAWTEVGTATFDLGGQKGHVFTNTPIMRGEFDIGGVDPYDVIEKKCTTL